METPPCGLCRVPSAERHRCREEVPAYGRHQWGLSTHVLCVLLRWGDVLGRSCGRSMSCGLCRSYRLGRSCGLGRLCRSCRLGRSGGLGRSCGLDKLCGLGKSCGLGRSYGLGRLCGWERISCMWLRDLFCGLHKEGTGGGVGTWRGVGHIGVYWGVTAVVRVKRGRSIRTPTQHCAWPTWHRWHRRTLPLGWLTGRLLLAALWGAPQFWTRQRKHHSGCADTAAIWWCGTTYRWATLWWDWLTPPVFCTGSSLCLQYLYETDQWDVVGQSCWAVNAEWCLLATDRTHERCWDSPRVTRCTRLNARSTECMWTSEKFWWPHPQCVVVVADSTHQKFFFQLAGQLCRSRRHGCASRIMAVVKCRQSLDTALALCPHNCPVTVVILDTGHSRLELAWSTSLDAGSDVHGWPKPGVVSHFFWSFISCWSKVQGPVPVKQDDYVTPTVNI